MPNPKLNQTSSTIEYLGASGYHTKSETIAQVSNATNDMLAGSIMVRNATSGKLEKLSDIATQRPIGILGKTIPMADIKAGDVVSFIITNGEVPASLLQLGALTLDSVITLTGYTLRVHLRSVGIIITQ